MRLIDADVLMEKIWREEVDTREKIADIIKNVPTFTSYDLDAERAVVGAMMLDAEAIKEAIQYLVPDDFYDRRYGEIYLAIKQLYKEGKPVDQLTLQDRLKSNGAPPEIVSVDYLRDLLLCVPISANVPYYVDIVYRKAMFREEMRRAMLKNQ